MSLEDNGKTPLVWGGPSGYKLGTITKTVTGIHDAAQHYCAVTWPNGDSVQLHPDSLELATTDDKDVVADCTTMKGPIKDDIWVLIRTSHRNFVLNVIEALPFGDADSSAKYVLGVTKFTLPNLEQSDYNLISYSLGQHDWSEKRTSDLFTAVNQIYMMWDLPPLEAVPLPLPSFSSIKDAAASCPPDASPAILLFHTPHKLADFSECMMSAAS